VATDLRQDEETARSHHAEPHRARIGGTDVLRRLRRVDADRAAQLGGRGMAARTVGRPFMLKGVMRVDEAKRAVDAGLTAISVSNHGGTTSTQRRPRSVPCRPSPTPLAARSRSCSTAASAAAVMTLGFFEHLASDAAVAWSSGSEPGTEINPPRSPPWRSIASASPAI
jgi:isopentenyl diphosphate isomerase/L-lactate dehydrogenase-like FMN-dependent dehydrogenase